jgi:hypothetical protein
LRSGSQPTGGPSDRLGRSLIDLLGSIQHLEAVGVDFYLDQQSIDTTTPAGKLLFQMTGAFAEFGTLDDLPTHPRLIKAKIERDGKFVRKAGRCEKDWGARGPRPASLIGHAKSWPRELASARRRN